MSAGQPPVNFHAHRSRAGESGAPEDFEQMLALLVQAISGSASLVYANAPGDWGIDVLIGELDGDVEIFQAKYLMGGVGPSQRTNIQSSFQRAVTAAAQHGYTVKRWVLCTPASLGPLERQWWRPWKLAQEAATGVAIELWDETVLRGLLLQPAARHIRRSFYEPYRDEQPKSPPAAIRSGPDRRWRPGNETIVGPHVYLLHSDATEETTADRTGTWREATAARIGSESVRVRLRQAVGPGVSEPREALRVQARLLRQRPAERGWPKLLDLHEGGAATTLVMARPEGRTWREAFGPSAVPSDRLTAARALAAASRVCAAIGALHGRGRSHRALTPDGIVVTADGVVLRDLGWAGLAKAGGAPGPAVDVEMVAALVHHTLTGHPPVPLLTPPVRATLPAFPEALDDLLLRALGPDPGRPHVRELGDALSRARRTLSLGGAA
ncbi:serine/threonine protein kinase [Dactylosporangium sp. NPDC048998]|uniref:serine/threonine protein kinase n=1 Tax=Dactylosporangium sp. NPDC048998 TaxID=3363976 RepID=UPI003718AAD2